jgi:hypothetical protein
VKIRKNKKGSGDKKMKKNISLKKSSKPPKISPLFRLPPDLIRVIMDRNIIPPDVLINLCRSSPQMARIVCGYVKYWNKSLTDFREVFLMGLTTTLNTISNKRMDPFSVDSNPDLRTKQQYLYIIFALPSEEIYIYGMLHNLPFLVSYAIYYLKVKVEPKKYLTVQKYVPRQLQMLFKKSTSKKEGLDVDLIKFVINVNYPQLINFLYDANLLNTIFVYKYNLVDAQNWKSLRYINKEERTRGARFFNPLMLDRIIHFKNLNMIEFVIRDIKSDGSAIFDQITPPISLFTSAFDSISENDIPPVSNLEIIAIVDLMDKELAPLLHNEDSALAIVTRAVRNKNSEIFKYLTRGVYWDLLSEKLRYTVLELALDEYEGSEDIIRYLIDEKRLSPKKIFKNKTRNDFLVSFYSKRWYIIYLFLKYRPDLYTRVDDLTIISEAPLFLVEYILDNFSLIKKLEYQTTEMTREWFLSPARENPNEGVYKAVKKYLDKNLPSKSKKGPKGKKS